jgi:hypothetical protein
MEGKLRTEVRQQMLKELKEQNPISRRVSSVAYFHTAVINSINFWNTNNYGI